MRKIQISLLAAVLSFIAPLAVAQQTGIPISQLPPAATPLAGTEVLPIVQGGFTRQIPVTALPGCSMLGCTTNSLTPHAVLLGNGPNVFHLATIGTAGRLLLDQGPNLDPLFVVMSGDCTLDSAGAIICSKTNGTPFGNLATQNAGTGLANSGGSLNLQPAQNGTIGGVEAVAQVTHQWVAYIDQNGIPHLSQPSISDIGNLGSGVASLLEGAANGANGPISQVLITSIPSLTIPGNSFLSLGYSVAGDNGAGFVFIKSTSADPSAVQDAAETWWGLAPSEVNKPVIFAFGAECDYNYATGNNDAPAINQAIDWENWLVTAPVSSPSAFVNLGGRNCSAQQSIHLQSSVWLSNGQISALSTPLSGTASITAANPAVVTVPGWTLQTNDIVYFPASDTLPAGLIAGRAYYAYRALGLQPDQFEISTQYIGTSIIANIPLVSTAGGSAASGQAIQIAWANTDNSYSKVQISIPQSTITITANSADIAWNDSHGTAISSLTVGDQIDISAINGTLPSELQTGPFYVHSINASAKTFEVSLTAGGGGSAVVPTTSPAGIFEAADANVAATVTWPNHGLVAGQQIYFTCWGAPGGVCTLPTGITANTTYYVLAANLTANSFEFSATSGGSPVVTSGFVQGVMVAHTVNPVTITTGSKTVVNWTGSNLRAGDILTFQGTLPTGMTAGRAYYVSNANGTLTANSAEIRACRDGAVGCGDLATSGSSSGVTAEWTGGEMFPPHDIDPSGTWGLSGYLGQPPVGIVAIGSGLSGSGLFNVNVNGGLLPSITDISNLTSISARMVQAGFASFGNYGIWNGGDITAGPSAKNSQQSPLIYKRVGVNIYNASPANAEKAIGIPNVPIPIGASDSIFDGIQGLSYAAVNFYADSHSPDISAHENHIFQGARANDGAWPGFEPVGAVLNYGGKWTNNEEDNSSVVANVNSDSNTGAPAFIVANNYVNDNVTVPAGPGAPGSWGEIGDFAACTQFDVSSLSTFDSAWGLNLRFEANTRGLTPGSLPPHYILCTPGSGKFSSLAAQYFNALSIAGNWSAQAVTGVYTAFTIGGTPNYGYLTTTSSGNTGESIIQQKWGVQGGFYNFQCWSTSAPPSGENITLTLRDNGAATALVCTIPGGAQAGTPDETHTATIASGDLLDMQITPSSGVTTSSRLSWSLQFTPQP